MTGSIATTDDAFLGGSLAMLQPKAGYRAGVDAVLLAAAVAADAEQPTRVLDAGAGVGVAGLCVARRLMNAQVVLIEREPELAALAEQNIARNGLAERARIVAADVTALPQGLDLAAESFSHVIANPPFHAHGHGTPAANRLRAAAHAMDASGLDQWARALARFCAPGGTALLIHTAEALGHILSVLDGRFGDLHVLPIAPRAGEPAIRVLVRGTKASRAPLRLLAPFVLHGPEGNAFTPAADAILRHGAALERLTIR